MKALRLTLALLPVLLVAGAVPALSSSAPSRPRDISALPMNPTAYARDKAIANARYAKWAKQHGVTTEALGVSQYTAVSGSLNQPGITDAATTGTPSDSTGAIGPSNYVEFINSEIAVYSNTDLTTPTDTLGESAFVGSSDFTCDPQIQWDPEGQRWLYAALDCNAPLGSEQLYFGWSKTSDPSALSSNWCRYVLNTGSNLEDYPKLGHDDSQIIIGTNEFGNDGASYTQSNIYVFDKPATGVSTCPTNSVEIATEAVVTASVNDFTPVPVNIQDSSATGYVVAANYTDMSDIDMYTVGRTGGGADTITGPTSVHVSTFDYPAYVPQPGTSEKLDSMDARLTQAIAVTDPNTGQEGIWTQHTIAGSGGGPSVVRWYELTPGTSTPAQAGTVTGPNNTFAFDAAISPTSDGSNAAIFYNSGSSSQRVDLRVQDRRSATTPGTTIEDTQLATSGYVDGDSSCDTANGSPCRWGDYAGASPDPGNACLVWGTGMLTTSPPDHIGTPQWGTQNAAIDTCTASYTLNVSTSGSGTVSSNPGGIGCSPWCANSFPSGASVTLTATPATGSSFTGWSGACSGTGTCNVTMTQAQSVTAAFALIPEGLTVSRSGTGSGTVSSNPTGISCGSTCSHSFDYGTAVQLTAAAGTGSTFTGWTGACSGTGACNVTMNQAQSVTATFALVPETLTVSKSGAGSGTVASTVSGISCGSTCSHAFDYGTTVTLTQTPGANSVFTGWLGACTGTGSCTVPMTAAQSVTATFGLVQETLTVTRSGKGKVVSTPAGTSCGSGCALFDYGTSVALTATPAPGYKFAGWKGACTGPGACTVSMTAATSVTAKFTKIVCVVPKVKGKKLAAAKRAITAAHCSVGTVKKKKSTTGQKGKVVSQKPKPGKHLSKGAPVNLVVGKGK